MRKVLIVLLILASAQTSHAAESVVSQRAGAAGRGESDFSQELKCGNALADSELVGARGYHVISGQGIILAGKRDDHLGFYSFGTHGATFSELGTVQPSGENLRVRTYHLQLQIPNVKGKTSFVYKQSRDSLGEAGFELQPKGGGQLLTPEDASDLFAEKALVARLNDSIASMPKNTPGLGSMMFPNLVKHQREKMYASLAKVVCGCKDVEGVREALAKMRASSEVKIYDVKYPCE